MKLLLDNTAETLKKVLEICESLNDLTLYLKCVDRILTNNNFSDYSNSDRLTIQLELLDRYHEKMEQLFLKKDEMEVDIKSSAR